MAVLVILQLLIAVALSALAGTGSTRAQPQAAPGLLPPPGSSPSSLVAIGNTLFFAADDGVHGGELWKSDGTPQGTVLVSDIYRGAISSSPSELTDVNGTLFFTADDGIHGRELWKSDGNAPGTLLVRDIVDYEAFGSEPYELTNVHGRLFFAARACCLSIPALWVSDGTIAGTREVYWFGRWAYGPTYFTAVGDTLFFIEGSYWNPLPWLWKSDGTSGGTTTIAYLRPDWLTAAGATLFFTNANTDELGQTNGTVMTAFPIRDADGIVLSPHDLANVGGTLYFGASSLIGEEWLAELWKSDGTESGTVPVKQFTHLASKWLYVEQLTAVGSTLFFVLDRTESTATAELWKSDGTETGTVPIANGLRPTPHDLTAATSTLFFVEDDGSYGDELWKSDGTSTSTIRVADIYPGAGSAAPSSLTPIGSTLFFVADDGIHGRELWKSNGTKAGTMLVQDIQTHYYELLLPIVQP